MPLYQVKARRQIPLDLFWRAHVGIAMLVEKKALCYMQHVVIRDFMDRPKLCYLVSAVAGVAYVISSEQKPNLDVGRSAVSPVGVPIDDVYIYEGGIPPTRCDWKKMRPWAGRK